MDEEQKTVRQRVAETHTDHPDWTAKQIAEHLGVERYHVYNNAGALGLKLAPAPILPPPVPALTTPPPAEAPPDAANDFTVYANDPAGMVTAQSALVEWCDQKIAVEAAEQQEAQRNLDAALKTQFGDMGWTRQVRMRRLKIDFYEKMKAALQAGYYIVPPFPLEIFAIRTKARIPRGTWKSSWWPGAHAQGAQMLPAGEGGYVSPLPELERENFGSQEKPDIEYHPAGFAVPEFPFQLAKAEILSATQAAMALKVFDRIGALPAQNKGDPIVCGQILMPHRMRSPVTFFISWWIDTKTL